jgi:hypothetical protein
VQLHRGLEKMARKYGSMKMAAGSHVPKGVGVLETSTGNIDRDLGRICGRICHAHRAGHAWFESAMQASESLLTTSIQAFWHSINIILPQALSLHACRGEQNPQTPTMIARIQTISTLRLRVKLLQACR